jgi:hypothetical protein
MPNLEAIAEAQADGFAGPLHGLVGLIAPTDAATPGAGTELR